MPSENEATRQNAMPEMERHKAELRALVILRILEREPDYRANGDVLFCHLSDLALIAVRQDVSGSFAFLEKNGLVKVETSDAAEIAVLTEIGADVALGKRISEGVMRPGPECPY